jgi:cell wall-associated NlpC family hydrolase
VKLDVLPDRIVETARTYLGVPWVHCGKSKETGVDCAGLIWCVFQDLGAELEEYQDYTLQDEFDRLLSEVNKYCTLEAEYLPEEEKLLDPNHFDLAPHIVGWTKGDILIFRARLMFNHCAIYTGDGNMIHAYQSKAFLKVVEQPLNANWIKRLHSRYKWQQ